MKKNLAFLLALLMLVPTFASCSEQTSGEDTTGGEAPTAGAEEAETEETEAPDPFADVDFGGRDFRILTSIYVNDSTNADKFIRGTGETNGEIVNDAVYARNLFVSELLGINFAFTESDYGFADVATNLKNLALAGADEYDIIANDIYQLAILASDGYLRNIYNSTVLDITQPYWYGDAMRDLQFIEGGMYMLLGDYFTDCLASAHTLFANESILNDNYGSTEYINEMVFNGNWTIDNMVSICETVARDTNGDGQMTEGDLFGYTCIGTWGSAIPALIGTGVQYVERTDEGISYCYNNERSVKILEQLNKMYWNNGTLTSIADFTSAGLRQVFANGQTVIMGYNRLGDLENLRDIEFGVGIIPYPKLDETQENYVISLHDTTEVGVILSTLPPSSDEFVHTCLEVLCRETNKQVIPQWYENALKVKYVDGQDDAKMIDLIHDSITSPFAVTYNTLLGNYMLATAFLTPLGSQQTDFASNYKKIEKGANKMLGRVYESFANNLLNGN
ncbi:MAG: hypothetical protein IJP32_01135 [Clostridia bacterium]|nr:hypothetical protein [Clostridia bacterium]MBQ9994947.1 hypothetical protein [Clostridia bacterium]